MLNQLLGGLKDLQSIRKTKQIKAKNIVKLVNAHLLKVIPLSCRIVNIRQIGQFPVHFSIDYGGERN